jgi:hypothetical protein
VVDLASARRGQSGRLPLLVISNYPYRPGQRDEDPPGRLRELELVDLASARREPPGRLPDRCDLVDLAGTTRTARPAAVNLRYPRFLFGGRA